MDVRELKKLFDDGILDKEKDYVIVDGTEVVLETDKDYTFSGWANEIIFEMFDLLDIPVEGA